MGDVVISMKNVKRVYKMGDTEEHALRGISFDISQGEFVAIMGPSGSGKSTCMNMIGCLDRPSSGIVEIGGRETGRMNEKELAELRNKTVGFVFQQYHLIPSLTVVENVMLPLRYQKIEKSERLPLAEAALEKVSLLEKEDYRPHELSGGQKQRVAIARALVTNPKIILADEPTGALDSETGKQIMDLFNEINGNGTTIVIVTHDPRIGAAIRRCIHIFDGQIKADVRQTPLPFSGDSLNSEKEGQNQPALHKTASLMPGFSDIGSKHTAGQGACYKSPKADCYKNAVTQQVSINHKENTTGLLSRSVLKNKMKTDGNDK